MSSTFNFSLSGDFSNNFDPGIFALEIRESSITTEFKSIRENGDNITIKFKSNLSGPETTTLNNLVASHNPNQNIKGKRRIIFQPLVESTKNTSYTKMGTFNYNGTLYDDSITRVEIFSYADTGVSSYDLRIIDITNANVIAEVTGLTNTSMQLNNLGTISNLPLDIADIEIQAKKNGGGSGNRFVFLGKVNFYLST